MKKTLSALLVAMLCLSSCLKLLDPMGFMQQDHDEKYYVNLFAYNIMQVYYLWKDEMQTELNNWRYDIDPVEKVKDCRYWQNGQEMDRWTQLTDDYAGFVGYVNGTGKSFGLDFKAYHADQDESKVYAVVTFTYDASPARDAGLKRGDVIVRLDGQEITVDNYVELLTDKLLNPTSVEVELLDGKKVNLTAVSMYENPVQTARVLTYGGKKIGYLHFSSFTQDCCKDLENAFRDFKAEGIEELVLDLRYNGGGYTTTCNALAAMIAPPETVQNKEVFNKEIYNAVLAEEMRGQTQVHFSDTLTVVNSQDQKQLIRSLEANPGISRLWVLQTEGTASASEALICGLKPYMDVTLIGGTSYGKFCGGFIIGAKTWFEAVGENNDTGGLDCDDAAQKTANWGIYVMVSRYADCNGITLSMPSGIKADAAVKDNPLDGHPLGDPAEPMLAAALALSAGEALPESKAGVGGAFFGEALPLPRRAAFGVRLLQR